MKNKEEMWDYLEDSMIATKEELRLVANINGYTEESMKDILYAKTGYRSFDQLEEEEE